MSILREAHDRALRLQAINEAAGAMIYDAKTSGSEVPRDRDSYAEPVITGHPADVVDRYTFVAQMGVPQDEGTRGRSSAIVKRAARIQRVVEAFEEIFGDDLAESDMEDEDEEDYEDEEDMEDEEDEDECPDCGRPFGMGRGMCRGAGMCGKKH